MLLRVIRLWIILTMVMSRSIVGFVLHGVSRCDADTTFVSANCTAAFKAKASIFLIPCAPVISIEGAARNITALRSQSVSVRSRISSSDPNITCAGNQFAFRWEVLGLSTSALRTDGGNFRLPSNFLPESDRMYEIKLYAYYAPTSTNLTARTFVHVTPGALVASIRQGGATKVQQGTSLTLNCDAVDQVKSQCVCA